MIFLTLRKNSSALKSEEFFADGGVGFSFCLESRGEEEGFSELESVEGEFVGRGLAAVSSSESDLVEVVGVGVSWGAGRAWVPNS